MDACRIAQTVVRGQRADGDAVAQGNAVEGFAWLNDVGTTGLYPFGCAQDEDSDGGKHERYNKDPAHGTTTMPASSIALDTRKRTEAAPFRITASPYKMRLHLLSLLGLLGLLSLPDQAAWFETKQTK